MNSMNHVTLLGQLTRPPRLRTLPSGQSVCDFGLALTRRWLDMNGDSKQETTIVEVTAWNQLGEVIHGYCRTGRPIIIEGRLEQERWQTPTGEPRSQLKVVADRATFLPGPDGTAPEAEPLSDALAMVLSDDPGH